MGLLFYRAAVWLEFGVRDLHEMFVSVSVSVFRKNRSSDSYAVPVDVNGINLTRPPDNILRIQSAWVKSGYCHVMDHLQRCCF